MPTSPPSPVVATWKSYTRLGTAPDDTVAIVVVPASPPPSGAVNAYMAGFQLPTVTLPGTGPRTGSVRSVPVPEL